jgi:hypothetical protein
MKYLEQRIEELEKEVALLKAKFKLQETKTTGFVNEQPVRLEKKDASQYLNNYPPAPDWKNKEISDYMYNPSINLLSNPDYVDSFDVPAYYPEYPNIVGSWDDKPFSENVTDDYGFKMNYEEPKVTRR